LLARYTAYLSYNFYRAVLC